MNAIRRLSRQRGQSLAEFAISLVILMILLAGLVDASRALFTFMALRDAAQEGAIYGSTTPWDEAGIIRRARESSTMVEGIMGAPCSYPASECPAIEVVFTDATSPATPLVNCQGDGVLVRVRYPHFPITMPFLGALIGKQDVPITATITDTVLRPLCPSSP
jgi:Flp pilus assembly protein TadG